MYLSLSESGLRYDYTPRLFHLTSWTGTFRVEEIASLTKVPDLPCAYPFLQVCIFPTRLDSSGFCSSSLTSGFLNRVLIDSAVFVIAEWVVQCQPTDTLLVGQWRRSVAVAGLVARRWEQGEQHHRGEKTSLDWRASLRLRNGPGLLPSEEGEEPSEGISGVGWARTSLFHLPVPELGARWTCNWNQCSGWIISRRDPVDRKSSGAPETHDLLSWRTSGASHTRRRRSIETRILFKRRRFSGKFKWFWLYFGI